LQWIDDGTEHPWDTAQDIVDSASDTELSRFIRAFALTAQSEQQLSYIGTGWLEDIESDLPPGEPPGRCVRVLLAAELEPNVTFRILSGIYPDWLEAMGASQLLRGHLSDAQIDWLVDPLAQDRRGWL
jgi:hypothetical protein